MKLQPISILLAACVGAGCGTGPAPQSGEPADVVLYNGKIITVDDKFSIVQAVAMRGERFIAVGANDAVRASGGPNTQQIDLNGRTVIPGLIDGHLHNAGGGPGVDLSKVRSIAELLAAVEARAKGAPPGELIVSNADWHEAQLHEKRLPHRTELDRVTPANPVVLVRGGHEFIVNSAALEHWNVSRETKSPPGGEIGHDADGNLNGELVDTARSLVKLPPPPKLTPEALEAQMKLLNAAGLTGIRIPGGFQFGPDVIGPGAAQHARELPDAHLRLLERRKGEGDHRLVERAPGRG
jgi:hypothetical protein